MKICAIIRGDFRIHQERGCPPPPPPPRIQRVAILRLAPVVALVAAVTLAAQAHELSTGNHAATYPLHSAAGAGNLAEVEHFLTAHEIHASTPDFARYTPLHRGVRRPSVVNRLIAAGANVHARNSSGEPPLHLAARANGSSYSPCLPAVVATILAAGADVNAEDDLGQTPLHEALSFSDGVACPNVAVALIEAGGDTSPFSISQDPGVPLNSYSPLYLLARNARGENELKPARALIRRGDDVNDGGGYSFTSTPLHHAWFRARDNGPASHGWYGLVDLLIENGAHYGTPCARGQVPNPRPTSATGLRDGEGQACICPTATHTEISGECQRIAACAAPAVRNETTNLCDCPSPNLGPDRQAAPGDCLVPNAERCGLEDPPLYYDAALESCGVRLYPCHESAVRLDDNSGCECPPERPFSSGDPSGGSFDSYGDADIPDSAICRADKRVSLLAAANGSLSANPAEATVTHGTTVTFTAAPDSGYEVSVWLADCVGASGLECALTVTLDVSVGVEFSDIDECALETHSCAAAGGVCANTAGAYDCGCGEGFSGNGYVCESDKRVSLLAAANGSLSANPAEATVTHGTTVTFTANPDLGYEVSAWLEDCAGASGLECALTVTVDVSVGVAFSDINECALETHSCAAAGGVCTNTAGAYDCGCGEGYSGNGFVCEADKRVSLLAAAHGSLSADPAEATVTHGTTVTFTAAPDSGFEFSLWLADCAGTAGRECVLTVTMNVSVGAAFSDIDECAAGAHDCANPGGRCENIPGGFRCGCAAGFSGDGKTCEADKKVFLLQPLAGGALAAGRAGDPDVKDGEAVPRGATVTFTATPGPGHHVSGWTGACEGRPVGGHGDAAAKTCAVTVTREISVAAAFADTNECDPAAAGVNAHNCGDNSACANTVGGFECACEEGFHSGTGRFCAASRTVCPAWGRYFDGAKCADCEVPDTAPSPAGDQCACQTAGHLIFGDAPNRRCAAPVICPDEYAGGDCVPHPRDGRKLDAGLLYSPSTCDDIFGGLLEDEFFCSEIDLNDTFCLTNSAEALPCAGLYEHVRSCNSVNRPALDPWHCGGLCPAGKMARGRMCETVGGN